MNYGGIDRVTVAALWLNLAIVLGLAGAHSVLDLGARFPSPIAWRPVSASAAATAVLLGALATAVPLVARRTGAPHVTWRFATAAALTVDSSLLIFLSGGAIEAHFHVFMVMAFLAAYADWRLEWVVAGLTGVHHTVVTAIDPAWVYVYGFHPLAPPLHAASVVLTAGFLTFLCENQRRTVSRLVDTRHALERDIEDRTRAQRELDSARAELSAQAKLATMGSLVSGVAHEVRTPLTYVSNHLHLIDQGLRRVPGEDPGTREAVARLRESSRAALEGVARIDHLVTDLRKHARTRPGERARLPLGRVVEEATHLFSATHRGQVALRTRIEATPEVELDRVQVQQVVLNLLENAADALPPGGTVHVTTRRVDEYAVIEVQDDGPGIPPDVQARMFDPFFTTKEEGTGMGLSIVHRIVQDHGGRLECETAPGEGTTFRVWLPTEGDR